MTVCFGCGKSHGPLQRCLEVRAAGRRVVSPVRANRQLGLSIEDEALRILRNLGLEGR